MNTNALLKAIYMQYIQTDEFARRGVESLETRNQSEIIEYWAMDVMTKQQYFEFEEKLSEYGVLEWESGFKSGFKCAVRFMSDCINN